MLLLQDEKPIVELEIQGQKVLFLVVSGACRSVVKDPIEGLRPSKKTVTVKTADDERNESPVS